VPHLVWSERVHASRRYPIAQDTCDPLIHEPPLADSAAANRSAKQRARRRALAPPAMRRRLPLEQTVRDRSILIALSARTLMVNISSSKSIWLRFSQRRQSGGSIH
jgi:hypothetical protein